LFNEKVIACRSCRGVLPADVPEKRSKYAVSPLKNKNIAVEIVSSHYVDPKGERVRS